MIFVSVILNLQCDEEIEKVVGDGVEREMEEREFESSSKLKWC